MKKNSQAFVNQLLVCLVVTIGFGGSIGLGTVWMRHRISVAANENRKLTADIDALNRRIKENETVIETEQRADALRHLNNRMSLGLVPLNEVQIEPITEDPVKRLIKNARRREILTDRAIPPNAKFALR